LRCGLAAGFLATVSFASFLQAIGISIFLLPARDLAPGIDGKDSDP
jgi:hypothetical protein